MNAKCEACGHPADIGETPSTWKCNCHAGVGREARRSDNPDGCTCDHVNYVDTSNVVTVVRRDDDGNVLDREEADLNNPPSWLNDGWTAEAEAD